MTEYAYQPAKKESQRRYLKALDFPEDYGDETPFKIRAYTKSELASAYQVDIKTLVRWINRHYDKFAAIGYSKNLKVLDPAMIKVFVEIFSTP